MQQSKQPQIQSQRQHQAPSQSQQSSLKSSLASTTNSSKIHLHKNSYIDVSQLASLINSQKRTVQTPSAAKISTMIALAKELTSRRQEPPKQEPLKHIKQLSSDILQSKSPQNRLIKQTSLKQIKPEPFVNYNQIKVITQKTQITETSSNYDQSSKTMFNFQYVIGVGGFGRVWRVDHKKTQNIYAMKEMSKALVITKKSVNSVMNERILLSQLKHPFIVNMHYAFQDRENLYLVMDYMSGGDLRYHISKSRKFTEETTKFLLACIIEGLTYLHQQNIIQRDIKPENLVVDQQGYVRITDMGIARVMKTENSQDTSGTPGYMAPEVMCRQNHTFAVDYFALGVIAFEFMMGRRPYNGRSRQEIRDQILAKQVQLKKTDVPEGWSLESIDFINRLIQRKPQNRLGNNGINEVKSHPWFRNFPWQMLAEKQIKAPFVPDPSEDNFDKRQIMEEDEDNNQVINQNNILLKEPGTQELFNGYEYNYKSEFHQMGLLKYALQNDIITQS